MFPIPFIWQLIGGVAILIAGIAWHETKVAGLKETVVAEERRRVAFASELLQKEALARAADIAAQNEREAQEHESEMADKDKAISEANQKIADLEKENTTCGVLSQGAVRQLNSVSRGARRTSKPSR
jgi:uncharacterized protein HemX